MPVDRTAVCGFRAPPPVRRRLNGTFVGVAGSSSLGGVAKDDVRRRITIDATVDLVAHDASRYITHGVRPSSSRTVRQRRPLRASVIPLGSNKPHRCFRVLAAVDGTPAVIPESA